MSKPKVLVVDPRWELYEQKLSAAFPEVDLIAAGAFDEVSERLPEVQVVITMGVPLKGIQFTPEIAAQLSELQWVQALVSGTEHIQRALAGRPEVLITSAAGIHGPQMSEMALMHMLALSRNLRTVLRQQDQARWQRVPQRILEAKTVGIVGMGAIGEHLAQMCAALGMRVCAFSRSERPVTGVDVMYPRERLPEVAPELDFLVLVVPHGPDTHHLVDAELLAAMKPSGCVINLGRGGVVDEAALEDALSSGQIAGAGLDVFEVEPLPADSPFWQMQNVILTPHLGGHHDRSTEQTLAVVEPNLAAFLAGRQQEMINRVKTS